ncbi:MAG: hypothetical protein PHT07_01650 [Paludibacter sp.]|nr:hypothetical protein [Paludibacter sp.]
MKKYALFLFALFCILNSNAEGDRSNRKSNPNYKNLKIYANVLQRYGKSKYYQIQIDIVNTGNKLISFWEDISSPQWTFRLSAGQVWFVSKRERQCYEKGITYKPLRNNVYRKIRILPHAKYTIKQEFFIANKEIFLKSNKNLRLIFHFNDANLAFMEDESRPKIISEKTIEYKW